MNTQPATAAKFTLAQTFELYGHTVEVVEVNTDGISHSADGTPAAAYYRVRFTSTRPTWMFDDTMTVSEHRLDTARPPYQPRHAAAE